MALQKIVNWKGYDYNYFKIASWVSNTINSTTQVTLRLYKDKATRDASVEDYIPLSYHDNYVDGVDLTRAEIYAALKLLPSWSDTTDA